MKSPDDAWVARWQSGDEQALASLLEHHVPALRSHLTVRYGEPTAEEAVSEVLYRLAAGIDYEHRGTFRAWLFSVGRRAAIDIVRRDRRIRLLAAHAEQELEPFVTHGGDRRFRDEQRRRRVERHLSSLPTLHRAAVRMRFWSGASTEEIADALQLSAGQVRDRLAYSMRAMRKRLSGRTLD